MTDPCPAPRCLRWASFETSTDLDIPADDAAAVYQVERASTDPDGPLLRLHRTGTREEMRIFVDALTATGADVDQHPRVVADGIREGEFPAVVDSLPQVGYESALIARIRALRAAAVQRNRDDALDGGPGTAGYGSARMADTFQEALDLYRQFRDEEPR